MSAPGPEWGSPEARARERRALVLAAGLSAALHAALLAALFRSGPPAPPPRGPLTVTLVEVERAGEPAGSAGAAERGGHRTWEGPRSGQRARGPAAGSATSREADARAAPRAELGPADASAVRGWFDAQGLGRERPAIGREALAISPPASLFAPGGGHAGSEEAEEAEAPAARAKRRVDGMLAEMRARDLARYPDASWIGLREALAGGFAPDFRVLRGGGQGTGDLFADSVDAYLGAAEAYGDTGRPFVNGPDAPGRVAAGQDAAVHAAVQGSREREELTAGIDALAAAGGKGLAQAWQKSLVTVIAVVEDAAGVVTGARVVSSSGNPVHDRLALEQARRLSGRLLSRRLAGTTTEWAFVTELSILPPLPVAGVSFDANFKPVGLVYPLKRSARSRIELVAVREAG